MRAYLWKGRQKIMRTKTEGLESRVPIFGLAFTKATSDHRGVVIFIISSLIADLYSAAHPLDDHLAMTLFRCFARKCTTASRHFPKATPTRLKTGEHCVATSCFSQMACLALETERIRSCKAAFSERIAPSDCQLVIPESVRTSHIVTCNQ